MINQVALKRAQEAGYIELGSMSEATMNAYCCQCRAADQVPIYIVANTSQSRLAWLPIRIPVNELPDMERDARAAVDAVVARSRRGSRVQTHFGDNASGWVYSLELDLARELAATLAQVLHRPTPDDRGRMIA